MKLRYIRAGDTLDDEPIVVVRGGDLDPDLLRRDALRHQSVYGTYGISVFAVRDVTLDERAQEPPLVPFDTLALITVGTLRAAGFRLCDRILWRNPYHED